jgi:hypothetical protein
MATTSPAAGERTLLNRSSTPVTALLFGAVPGPGYQPPSWA